MNKLVIKNIGAIKDIKLDINRINVFIGPQSSGKSTISKILCFCMWVEKDCFLNKDRQEYYEKKNVFYDSLVNYHRLEGYFNKGASIEYSGDYLSIKYNYTSQKATITPKKEAKYNYPKISYIPSERNMVTAVDNFSSNSDSLFYFKNDWTEARSIIGEISMSDILERQVKFEYDKNKDKNFIYDGDNRLPLLNASSGILSLTPLYLLISYMYKELYTSRKNSSISKQEVKKYIVDTLNQLRINVLHDNDFKAAKYKEQIAIFKEVQQLLNKQGDLSFAKDKIANKADLLLDASIDVDRLFEYKYTELFIEEPEQNLFPKAQMKFVDMLFQYIYSSEMGHCAVITTHSPYILFAINNCIMRNLVKDNIPQDQKDDLLKEKALIAAADISLYQIEDGVLKQIQDEDGNLDENFINDAYKENSAEYFSLLNFYQDEE